MDKKALFITSQPDLQQLSNIFLNNGEEHIECMIASSISKSVEILNASEEIDLIFLGHKIDKDLELKELTKVLLPKINGGVTKIYGTNRAFKGKEFAKYYNELVPISKILIDIYSDLEIAKGSNNGYISFPLLGLLEFKIYPFDCFFKMKKQDEINYVHVFREKEEIDFEDIYKYQEKNVKSVFVSEQKVNEKIKILENALKHQAGEDLGKDPEKSFEVSAQYAIDVLKESGLKLPDEIVDRNREAFSTTKEILKSPKGKKDLQELMGKSNDFYFKHVSMTSLMCCFILGELGVDEDANLKKLCAAANFQNIFLKDEKELMVFDDEQLEHFDEEQRKRIERHPLMACDLLSNNPLIDSDVLKIVKEQHGDKRGMTFPGTIVSSSKMSTIFQIASIFSQKYLIDYERDGSVDAMKVFAFVTDRLSSKDQNILKGIRQVVAVIS